MNLEQLGWTPFFAQASECNADEAVGRVAQSQGEMALIYAETGQFWAKVSGTLRYEAKTKADLPVVGDWVLFSPKTPVIRAILPRKSQLSRQAAGNVTQEQVVAANLDTVFLVVGLDNDFNLRRIERYLLAIWDSGAIPVILLNKADICDEVEQRQVAVEAIAFGVPIFTLSAAQNQGLEPLHAYLGVGQTVALIGSSGAGKSTLINALAGREVQATQAVRFQDSRGRHTTTTRTLIVLPPGGLLIDTPGMRELQLWQADVGFAATFADIEALAEQCRFRDCQHDREPGCAVQDAIATGQLSMQRWHSYQKLQRELNYAQLRQDTSAQQIERRKWKQIHKAIRRHPKR
jgi:ribosome biogenesis GTPase